MHDKRLRRYKIDDEFKYMVNRSLPYRQRKHYQSVQLAKELVNEELKPLDQDNGPLRKQEYRNKLNLKCEVFACPKDKGANGHYCSSHQTKWLNYRRVDFTRAQFESRMEQRNCDLCGTYSDRLWLDYDRSSGIGQREDNCRGMVCAACGSRLAGLDDRKWLEQATKYLDGWKENNSGS